jgi:hypothetical protein
MHFRELKAGITAVITRTLGMPSSSPFKTPTFLCTGKNPLPPPRNAGYNLGVPGARRNGDRRDDIS